MTLAALLGGIRRILAHPALPYGLALATVLLMSQALSAGFQLDDHFQRARLLDASEPSIRLFEFYDGDVASNRSAMDEGRLPWWTSEDLKHKSFRYLSVLTMQLDYALWPEKPALMHLHSLAWFAALIIAAAWLYRRVIGASWVAGLAALLYAIDDAHFEPVQYLANRNALIATCLGALCLVCFDRYRRERWTPGAFLSPLFLALGLAASEIGVATAAYLASYTIFLDRDQGAKRALALAPCAAVGVCWAAVYGAFGFGASGSGFYASPLSDPASFVSLLWQRAPILLLGQWTPIPADFALASDPTQNLAPVLQQMGLVTTAILALLMAPLLLRSRIARFWAVGALLSLVPIASTGPQNRLLFFVGIGSSGLLAMFIDDVVSSWQGAGLRSRRWIWPASAAAGLLLVFHLPLAALGGLLAAQHQRSAEQNLRKALESVPNDPALRDQDLILVNPPDHTYTVGLIGPYAEHRGEPVARRVRALSVGASPIEVMRVDSHTLDVRLEYGLFSTPISRYFRSDDRPFHPGEAFSVEDLAIEIRSLKTPSNPETLRYRFAAPLEATSLRWLQWQDGAYVPFSPPGVGDSVALAPGRGIFDPE